MTKAIQPSKDTKHPKEPEVFWYVTSKGEKLWMYRHRYNDSFGKRTEKNKSGFKTDKAAIKALLQVKASILNGQIRHIESENLTVEDWLDQWYEMNKKKWKESTRIQRENAINNHIKPLIGRYKLSKLDRALYQRAFIDALESTKKYSARSIILWHNIFKVAINAAVEEEILLRNKLRKVVLPSIGEVEETKVNFLNENDLKVLLHDVKENEEITAYSLFLTLAYTGMRKGEAMGLQWKNIDFDNHTITVERTRDNDITNSPKTKNSYRTILIDEIVIKQLEAYKKWCKERLFSFGKKLNEDMYVFILESALPIYSKYANNILTKTLKRTKIKNFTVHGLRHTHATILLNRKDKKIDAKVIADRLGNTTDMIYKVYGHILKDLEKEAVSIFSDSLAVAKEE